MIDYHTHSRFSYDNGPVTMDEMIMHALDAGITHIAITDHYDPLFPEEDVTLDFPRYIADLERVKEMYSDRINIAAGIELGMQPGKALDMCAEAVEKYNFDFVIGSVHATDGYGLHTMEFERSRTPLQSKIDYYSDLLTCIKDFNGFNVLGHLNVIDRYTRSVGENDEVNALVREIFDVIIRRNQGIEINTSFLRAGNSEPMPSLSRVREFVQLGGTVITTSSDAHNPDHIGSYIKRAEEIILSTGLSHVTIFENRKPRTLAISQQA